MKTYENALSRVKGLGSAKNAVDHWWWQRVSAIANIFLMLWLVCLLTKITKLSVSDFLAVAAEPLNTMIGVLLVISTMYHGNLGMQVIIEDYIPNRRIRNFLLITIQFAVIATMVAGVCALIFNHVTYFRIETVIIEGL